MYVWCVVFPPTACDVSPHYQVSIQHCVCCCEHCSSTIRLNQVMSQQAPPPILCHAANVANVGSSAVLGPLDTVLTMRRYHVPWSLRWGHAFIILHNGNVEQGTGYNCASVLLTPNFIFSASQCSLDWLQFVSYDIVNKMFFGDQ